MAYKLLISKADFAGRIELSNNLDASKKLDQHILHAQEFDLCGLMGDKFYYYLFSLILQDGTVDPAAPQAVIDLVNGSTYNNNWNNPGLKPVLVYYTGARLIRSISNHITPNNFAVKTNEFSTEVSKGDRLFQALEYENQAAAYWTKVVGFLNFDKTAFSPYYGADCGCDATGMGLKRPRTISIGAKDCEGGYYGRG